MPLRMIHQSMLISYWIKDYRERLAPARRSSLYTSFVGWISGHASTEHDRDRLVYKLNECRTRRYVLADALALIHPTCLGILKQLKLFYSKHTEYLCITKRARRS